MEKDARYGPLTRRIADNARKIRAQQRLSLADVAERMTALGRPLALNGISKIERGNRGVDLDDLAALARALDVPPLLLIFPVGHEPTVEALPGYEVRTWDAARWFTGEEPLPNDAPGQEWVHRQRWLDSAARLFRERDYLHRQWERINEDMIEQQEAGRPVSDDLLGLRATWYEALRRNEDHMRRLGVEPDPVELAAAQPVLDTEDYDFLIVDADEGDRGQR